MNTNAKPELRPVASFLEEVATFRKMEREIGALEFKLHYSRHPATRRLRCQTSRLCPQHTNLGVTPMLTLLETINAIKTLDTEPDILRNACEKILYPDLKPLSSDEDDPRRHRPRYRQALFFSHKHWRSNGRFSHCLGNFSWCFL